MRELQRSCPHLHSIKACSCPLPVAKPRRDNRRHAGCQPAVYTACSPLIGSLVPTMWVVSAIGWHWSQHGSSSMNFNFTVYTAAQLENKRIKDREAQRLLRKRIREDKEGLVARVRQLESEVDNLRTQIKNCLTIVPSSRQCKLNISEPLVCKYRARTPGIYVQDGAMVYTTRHHKTKRPTNREFVVAGTFTSGSSSSSIVEVAWPSSYHGRAARRAPTATHASANLFHGSLRDRRC